MSVALSAAQRTYAARQQLASVTRSNALAMVEVGRKLNTVVDHPGWQEYVDHLESIIAAKTKQREQITKDMLDGDTLGQELEKTKIAALKLGEEIKGLRTAVDLIPELLKRAAKAAEGLGGPDRPNS